MIWDRSYYSKLIKILEIHTKLIKIFAYSSSFPIFVHVTGGFTTNLLKKQNNLLLLEFEDSVSGD